DPRTASVARPRSGSRSAPPTRTPFWARRSTASVHGGNGRIGGPGSRQPPPSCAPPKPTSPENPSFGATAPCYRFRGREPPRDRPPTRAPGPGARFPLALPGHARLWVGHMARARRTPDRRAEADAFAAVDERAADRRHPADVARRPARGATCRPPLAPSLADRIRPRSLRRLLRTAVCPERDHDRRPGGGNRHRDRLLPVCRLRRSPKPRRRRRSPTGELALAGDRQLDVGDRLARRRRARRRAGPAPRLLDQC